LSYHFVTSSFNPETLHSLLEISSQKLTITERGEVKGNLLASPYISSFGSLYRELPASESSELFLNSSERFLCLFDPSGLFVLGRGGERNEFGRRTDRFVVVPRDTRRSRYHRM
jgi:hypothetical protein